MNVTSEHAQSSFSSGNHESTTLCGAQGTFQLPTYNVTGGVAQVRQDPPQFKDYALHPLLETTLSPRVDNSFTILDKSPSDFAAHQPSDCRDRVETLNVRPASEGSSPT